MTELGISDNYVFNIDNEYYIQFFIIFMSIIGPVERKIAKIFLPINLNICFGCSTEPSN